MKYFASKGCCSKGKGTILAEYSTKCKFQVTAECTTRSNAPTGAVVALVRNVFYTVCMCVHCYNTKPSRCTFVTHAIPPGAPPSLPLLCEILTPCDTTPQAANESAVLDMEDEEDEAAANAKTDKNAAGTKVGKGVSPAHQRSVPWYRSHPNEYCLTRTLLHNVNTFGYNASSE